MNIDERTDADVNNQAAPPMLQLRVGPPGGTHLLLTAQTKVGPKSLVRISPIFLTMVLIFRLRGS